MKKIFSGFKKQDWILWFLSVSVVFVSNILTHKAEPFTLVATLIGVTAILFVAKGNVIGQFLTILFSVFYSITSFKFRYYGEIITYLGMTAPIAAFSILTWLKHPVEKGKNEVKIHTLTKKKTVIMWSLTVVITMIFYFILEKTKTPNLIFSTISISTSFLASFLMLFRNSNYAVAYAANDVVLIILWIFASLKDISYFPMIICFVIFLINDLYGYFCWKKREKENNKLYKKGAD